MASTLDQLVADIAAWQRETFPYATPASVAAHLLREAQELGRDPVSADEIADVFHLCVSAALVSGYNLAEIVAAKFARNQARTWGTPDAEGVVEHTAEAPNG